MSMTVGMRFAKLEQNIITAYFMAAFEFELTDKDGRSVAEAPKPDINEFSAHKPKNRVYLKYWPRDE
jgi:hypothetical protein